MVKVGPGPPILENSCWQTPDWIKGAPLNCGVNASFRKNLFPPIGEAQQR